MEPGRGNQGKDGSGRQRSGENGNGKETKQVVVIGKARKLGRAAPQQQRGNENFGHVQRRRKQSVPPGSLGESAADYVRNQTHAQIGGPTVPRSQKEISQQDAVRDPDHIGYGGDA